MFLVCRASGISPSEYKKLNHLEREVLLQLLDENDQERDEDA